MKPILNTYIEDKMLKYRDLSSYELSCLHKALAERLLFVFRQYDLVSARLAELEVGEHEKR